ncbi:alpha/beta hydrolase [Cytobacillus sp. S13-E01]|uniref:alpha/beta fold hydrolase n=1 Tax=Cytobacillus sp. S13-E01 TaxID=3031326 RepID=UPI0023D8AB5D|nr:alpha/beta hydrolase [Cytobacillus sp. S13-E01]MDF0727387.1 alpha/beta hydrolase [Cytobacillus sp. S13-E01]
MLHYKTYILNNSLPWVTFIHGAGGSSSVWYKQVKEYKKHFNILLLDLRGHGRSSKNKWRKNDNFQHIAEEVIEVLNHLKIDSSHFVGISLGTVVIQTIAQQHAHRIKSMVLGGAVTELIFRSRLLLALGNMGKYLLPYMLLYRLFAWIMMPKLHHKEARNTFVSQAKKLCQKEFIRWFSLTRSINPFLRKLQHDFNNIPTLFIMGEQDHMFLPPVKQLAARTKEVALVCIKHAGHVCNIDSPTHFNQVSIEFITNNSKVKSII